MNSTGITTVALPNTNLGVNVPEGSDAGDGYTYVRVFNASQSTPLIVHLIAGIVLALGIALLLIPYKAFSESSPHLSRLLKTGSLTLILTAVGFVLGIIAFAIDLVVSINTVNQFNSATQRAYHALYPSSALLTSWNHSWRDQGDARQHPVVRPLRLPCHPPGCHLHPRSNGRPPKHLNPDRPRPASSSLRIVARIPPPAPSPLPCPTT